MAEPVSYNLRDNLPAAVRMGGQLIEGEDVQGQALLRRVIRDFLKHNTVEGKGTFTLEFGCRLDAEGEVEVLDIDVVRHVPRLRAEMGRPTLLDVLDRMPQ